MKQAFFTVGGLLLALALGLLLPAIGLPAELTPDLVVIVLVVMTPRVPAVWLLLAAWLAGYGAGSFAAVPAGAAACGKLAAAYAAVNSSRIVDTRGRAVMLAVVFAATLLDTLVSGAVSWFVGARFGPLAGGGLGRALATTLVATILLGLYDRLQDRGRTRRRLAW